MDEAVSFFSELSVLAYNTFTTDYKLCITLYLRSSCKVCMSYLEIFVTMYYFSLDLYSYVIYCTILSVPTILIWLQTRIYKNSALAAKPVYTYFISYIVYTMSHLTTNIPTPVRQY